MVTLQIGCLIITGFIMALYFSTKRVRTSSHRVYCALLILSVFYLIFDRITVYTVNHLESTAPVLNQVMHRFFLMSLLGCVYLIFRYVLLMIFPKPPHIRASYIPMVCSVAGSRCVIALLPGHRCRKLFLWSGGMCGLCQCCGICRDDSIFSAEAF